MPARSNSQRSTLCAVVCALGGLLIHGTGHTQSHQSHHPHQASQSAQAIRAVEVPFPRAHLVQLAPLIQPDGALSSAWRYVGFPSKHAAIAPTQFSSGSVQGQPALKVAAQSSYGTWVHPWSGSVPAGLQWWWMLDEPLAGGNGGVDVLTKSGDDAALRVCVMFDLPLDRIAFFERTMLRFARMLTGEPLPAATLCYIWDSAGPAPREGTNPYTQRVRFISLKGRSAPLSRWVLESRDVGQDFARLFANELPLGERTPRKDLPHVTQVLIGADSDNTGSQSVGWLTDMRWER